MKITNETEQSKQVLRIELDAFEVMAIKDMDIDAQAPNSNSTLGLYLKSPGEANTIHTLLYNLKSKLR